MSGRSPRRAPRAPGAGGDDSAHQSSNGSPVWSTVLSSGTRRRYRRGRWRRRAVPLLGQRCALAASFSMPSVFGVLEAGGVAEQVGRHGRGLPEHVVGHDLREVEHQGLVDFGLDIEDVAELVDPVVHVHGIICPTRSRTPNALGQVSRSSRCVDVAASSPCAGTSPGRAPAIRRASPRRRSGRAGRASSAAPRTANARCRRPDVAERRPVAGLGRRQQADVRSAPSPPGMSTARTTTRRGVVQARVDPRTPPLPGRRTPAARASKTTGGGRSLVADHHDGPRRLRRRRAW